MSGYIIPLVYKRLVAFSSLTTGQTQDLILADRVDLLHWREVTLVVKVHDHTLSAGVGSITIGVVPQSWTREEPETTFVGAPMMLSTISSSVPSPGMLTALVTMTGANCMAAMARIIARGSRSASGSMLANLSIELATKDA